MESPKHSQAELEGPFGSLLDQARNLPLEETKALLITAGILTPAGELAPHYQPQKQLVKKLLESKNGRAKKVTA